MCDEFDGLAPGSGINELALPLTTITVSFTCEAGHVSDKSMQPSWLDGSKGRESDLARPGSGRFPDRIPFSGLPAQSRLDSCKNAPILGPRYNPRT